MRGFQLPRTHVPLRRRPSQLIAVVNQKGGVGKTTTTVNLAACLAAMGKRVLLVDLDSQANATSGLGIDKTPGASIYGPLLGEGGLESRILSTAFENLDLVPSEVDLCGAEMELTRVEGHLFRMKKLIGDLRSKGNYEVVLFDCPPSLALITLNAFVAADWLIVPLQCEYYSLEGIATLTRVRKQLRDAGSNTRLEILGIVMTMFDARTRLSAQVVRDVEHHFGERVFRTRIPRTVRLAEAPSHGKPIIHYDRYSAGSAAYENLAREVAERLEEAARNNAPSFGDNR